jgi:hypothetical protein
VPGFRLGHPLQVGRPSVPRHHANGPSPLLSSVAAAQPYAVFGVKKDAGLVPELALELIQV